MDSTDTITLNWTDFVNVSDLTYHEGNEAGIYIWGFTINDDFVPYYVGIADNIIFRIHEHLNSIIGGRYTIFHSNSLANFRQFKNQDVHMDKSQGIIYIPNWPYGFKLFLDNRKELKPHIDFMVDTFTFSCAKVDRELVSREDLKAIEKICINQIGKDNLINTRSGHSDRFLINHCGNKTVVEMMKATNH